MNRSRRVFRAMVALVLLLTGGGFTVPPVRADTSATVSVTASIGVEPSVARPGSRPQNRERITARVSSINGQPNAIQAFTLKETSISALATARRRTAEPPRPRT